MQLSLWQVDVDSSQPPNAPGRLQARHYDSLKPGGVMRRPAALKPPEGLEEAAQRYERLTHTDATRASYQSGWDPCSKRPGDP